MLRVLNLTLKRPFGTCHGLAVVRENQKRLRSLRAKCLSETPAKRAAQAVDDFKSVPRPNTGCHRSAVLHAAFHERPVLPNRDANCSAAVPECVSRCVRYKLVDDHSQAPATLGLQPQRLGRKDEADPPGIQPGATDGKTELTEVRGSVHRGIVVRHLQEPIDVRITVKELCNASQGGFDFFIAGTRSSNGCDADGGGEFIVDPVVQLVQQHMLLRDQRRRVYFGHGILLIEIVPRRAICNTAAEQPNAQREQTSDTGAIAIRNQCATGAGPPSFTLRRISASGTAAAEISISVQKTSM